VPELVPDREAAPDRRALRLLGVDPDLALMREQQAADPAVRRQAGELAEVVAFPDEQPVVAVGDRLDRDWWAAAVPEPVGNRRQFPLGSRLSGKDARERVAHRPPRKSSSTSSHSSRGVAGGVAGAPARSSTTASIRV